MSELATMPLTDYVNICNMATINYEDVTPSLIPNTTMQKMFIDGVHKVYVIGAVDGYVLHDNRADEVILDDETLEPTGEVILRYATGTKTVAASYDFNTVVPDTIIDVNGNEIAVNKIGAFELFAVPISAVPENNTYGAGNDHEIAESGVE